VNISVDDSPLPPIKVQEVKAARTLASEITQGGAKLYDLLTVEQKNRCVNSQYCQFIMVVDFHTIMLFRPERIQALRFMDQPGINQGEAMHGLSTVYYINFKRLMRYYICILYRVAEGSKEYQYIEKSLREVIDQTKRSLEDLK
jgi:hypothetical protein